MLFKGGRGENIRTVKHLPSIKIWCFGYLISICVPENLFLYSYTDENMEQKRIYLPVFLSLFSDNVWRLNARIPTVSRVMWLRLAIRTWLGVNYAACNRPGSNSSGLGNRKHFQRQRYSVWYWKIWLNASQSPRGFLSLEQVTRMHSWIFPNSWSSCL